jgi:hypothetical protein
MAPISNSNESYCTFTLASDVTAGGLPSEAEIAKDLESNDDNVRTPYAGHLDFQGLDIPCILFGFFYRVVL